MNINIIELKRNKLNEWEPRFSRKKKIVKWWRNKRIIKKEYRKDLQTRKMQTGMKKWRKLKNTFLERWNESGNDTNDHMKKQYGKKSESKKG